MLHQSYCTDSSNTQIPATPSEPEKPRVSTTEGSEDCRGERLEISKEAASSTVAEDSGRERLKRHRVEMAGRVWIPEIWGKESLLKEWVDCSAFDSSLVPNGVASAREALVEECRRANSGRLRIENRC